MRRVHVVFGGARPGDYELLLRLAGKGSTDWWEVLKQVKEGDGLLIYCGQPTSAIIATAISVNDARKSPDDGLYVAKIGEVQIVETPISLGILRRKFPNWKWLKSLQGKHYVEESIGQHLWHEARRGESSESQNYTQFNSPPIDRSLECPPSDLEVRFQLVLAHFNQAVIVHPDSEGCPFSSFQSGMVRKWERYKEVVLNIAEEILEVDSWKESKIGSGGILKKVIAAIEINEGKGRRNNLVQWDGRYGDERRSHRRLHEILAERTELTIAEKVLFRHFRGIDSPKASFESIVNLVGARYDLIAYLFFLRDWERFMPVKPTVFQRAFEILGMPMVLNGNCSWENYLQYLEKLEDVASLLRSAGVRSVRLIDAHSFCWMLDRLLNDEIPKSSSVPIRQMQPRVGTIRVEARPSQESFEAQNVDYAALHADRQLIGRLAQGIVMAAERDRLNLAGQPNLAARIEDVSLNSSLGYDISSFTTDGEAKPIEVKAASHFGGDIRFFLSENERSKSKHLKNYTFALVLGMATSNKQIWEFAGSDLPQDALVPVQFEIRLKKPN